MTNLLRGGQGRSADDIRNAGTITTLLVLALLVLVIACWVMR